MLIPPRGYAFGQMKKCNYSSMSNDMLGCSLPSQHGLVLCGCFLSLCRHIPFQFLGSNNLQLEVKRPSPMALAIKRYTSPLFVQHGDLKIISIVSGSLT